MLASALSEWLHTHIYIYIVLGFGTKEIKELLYCHVFAIKVCVYSNHSISPQNWDLYSL